MRSGSVRVVEVAGAVAVSVAGDDSQAVERSGHTRMRTLLRVRVASAWYPYVCKRRPEVHKAAGVGGGLGAADAVMR